MKKLFFLSLSLSLFSVSFAQTKTAPKASTPAVKAAVPKPAPKAAPATKPGIVLKTAEDSMSYSIGVLDGNFFKSQGIDKINSSVLASGFADALKGKPLFTPEQCDMIVRTAMQKNVRKKYSRLLMKALSSWLKMQKSQV